MRYSNLLLFSLCDVGSDNPTLLFVHVYKFESKLDFCCEVWIILHSVYSVLARSVAKHVDGRGGRWTNYIHVKGP